MASNVPGPKSDWPDRKQERKPTYGVGAGGDDKAFSAPAQHKKKENIVDLSKYQDKMIRVKFQGGREVSGTLKGHDPLLNLVLDNAVEFLRDPDDEQGVREETRPLGLTVCRGIQILVICPADGLEAIANPFIQHESGQE